MQRAKAAPTLAAALSAALDAVRAADCAMALGRAHGGHTQRDAEAAQRAALAAVEVAAGLASQRCESQKTLSEPAAVSHVRRVS